MPGPAISVCAEDLLEKWGLSLPAERTRVMGKQLALMLNAKEK